MIVIRNAPHPGVISLDLTREFGLDVELDTLQFLNAPGSYRLLRFGRPIMDWKRGDKLPHSLDAEPATGRHQKSSNRSLLGNGFDRERNQAGLKTVGLELELSGLDPATYVLFLRNGTFVRVADVVIDQAA